MIVESVTIGKGGKYPLPALLTLPDHSTCHPVPAVVLVHGSGPSNMDERVGGLTPFKDLALGLAERGIAVLRYDKRTFVHGRKLVKEKNITVSMETIEDVLLATQLLRSHSGVDSRSVFLLGHSMGAMLAPRIDAEGGDYRGLILMAGSPRPLEEIMLDQNRAVLKESGALIRLLVGGQLRKLEQTFAQLHHISDEEALGKKLGNGVSLYYFKEMAAHPAPAYLEKLEKPLLILQGDQDFQATVQQDFSAYRALLSHRPNVTFRLYPGLNHAFVPAIHTNILKARQEYRKERHIGADVLTDIADFILENSKQH